MRAVAYYRRSSTKQEKSIAAQRKSVREYAAERGIEIIHEYVDDGISGNKLEERKAFLQMRHDMTVDNVADTLIVWDMDRFGRHDGMKTAAVLEPFRETCIEIHTVRENKIVDLDSLGGCLENFIQSENNHDYLRKLSSNTLGGRLRGAALGHIGGQAAPYGFDRMVVSADGKHLLRLKNGDPKPTRAANTHITFVPSDDPEVVQTIRWIFDEYANNDVSQRAICDNLNRDGIPGARGGKWSPSTLAYILKNENYIGTYVFGKRTTGEFFRVSGDNAKPRDKRDWKRAKIRRNDDAEMIKVPDAFPGLIDGKTFKAVQARLQGTKRTGRYRKTDRQRYPLAGLVYCGCCDGKMYGQHTSRRKNGKLYEWNKYKCSTNLKHGHRDKYAEGCFHCQVDDGPLTRFVADSLQKQLTPANLKRLEAALIRKASKPQKTTDLSALKRKLNRLNTDINKAADRLLRADDDLMDILSPRLREMRQDRDRLAERLDNEAIVQNNPDREVRQAMERLKTLSQDLQDDTHPERRRHVFQQLVSRVVVNFEQTKKNGRTASELTGGHIEWSACGCHTLSIGAT